MKKTLLIIPALLVLMLVWAAPAHSTGPVGEWHTWEVQGDYGPDWDPDHDQAFNEPQKYVGEGRLAPKCGTWYQQDNYRYPGQGKTIAEVIEDKVLTKGEDYHLTKWGGEGTAWKFVYGGECGPEVPTTDKWDLSIEATCAGVTISHPQFKQSTHPEYRVDVDGVQGERVPYTWGETVTIPAPDAEVDTVWEVRIFAKNPALGGAYQQLGAKKVWSRDCAPVVEPEPTPEPVPSVTPEPEPEPVEETRAHYGASSCVPGVEGLAIRSFGEDFFVNGKLVPEKSKSWTEHVSDPGCTLPTSDPQAVEAEALPAKPVEAEAPPTLAETGPALTAPLAVAAILTVLGVGVVALSRRRVK